MEQQRNIIRMAVFFVLGLIVIIISWNSIFVTIEAGEKGVLFRKISGLDKKTVYPQGLHFIAPWNKMFIYDVRIQEVSETMDVLSSNGLSINVDISLRYKPIANKIGYLHDEIGKDYLTSIVIPQIRSATREVIGKYTPEELYSTKREAVQSEIIESSKKALTEKYVDIDALLIRSVKLPETIRTAIESKLKQEQEFQQMAFVLKKSEQEAENQRIQAEGKAKANRILSASLTDKILREKGIEATKELAKSNNSKVVIIGSGKSGMPIILGGN